MSARFLPVEFVARVQPGAPRISVVTATRDSARTLGATLASVAGQTLREVEHLIIDGASRDGTQALAETAGVRVWSEPDEGIYDAFNKGLLRSRGELIAFLGSDDVYAAPDVLARIAAAADEHPRADVFHGDLLVVDSAGSPVSEHRFYPKFDIDSPRNRDNYRGTWLRQVFHPCTFFRRRVFARVGGFDTSYRIAGDVEHLLRAREAGIEFRYVAGAPLVRMANQGISSQRAWEAELETLRAFRAHSDSRLRPYAQFLRTQLVAVLERRTPRALAAVRWALGSPRASGYGDRLRSGRS